MIYEFMAWLQGSALGHAMRESGVWTYGIVNLVHILGVAALFGAVANCKSGRSNKGEAFAQEITSVAGLWAFGKDCLCFSEVASQSSGSCCD